MAVDKNTILNNAQRYAARGQIDKAIEEWQKLIRETPNDGNIYNTIGDLYLRNNSIQDAVSAFLKAGDIYYKAGFALKTIALYKKVNKIDPENIEVYLKLGALNAERGLTGNARDDYLRAARLYLKQGQNKQAVVVYKKIAELEPENISAHQKIAEMCIKEGLKKDAAEEYINIAEIHLKNNEIKEAEDFYSQALSVEPGNRKAELGIGNLKLKQDKLQDGINILEGILEKRPDDINTLNLFVDACFKNGDYLKAEESLKHLITLEPDNLIHHEKLGYVYLKKGLFKEAISEFRTIFEEYVQNNEYDKIKKIAQEVLDADHKNIDAHTMLIDIYEKAGNEGGKIAEYLSIADIYVEQNLLEKAENIYQDVLNIDPNNMEAKTRLEKIRSKELPEDESLKEGHPEDEKLEAPEEIAEPLIEEPMPPQSTSLPEERLLSDEDAEKIEGYYTEADVYLKYGLTNKSIEQLELILAIQPQELKARKKLKDIYKIEGEKLKAVDECIAIAKIYEERGDIKKTEEILKEAFEIDPENEKVINKLNGLSGAPVMREEALKTKNEPKLEEGGIPTVELSDLDLEGITSFIASDEPEEVKPFTDEKEVEDSDIPVIGEEELQTEAAEAAEIDKISEVADYSGNIQEAVAEADFYMQQGLISEAKGIYERILASDPDNDDIKKKMDNLLETAKTEDQAEPAMDVKASEKEDAASFKVYGKDEESGEGSFFDLSKELDEEIAEAPAEHAKEVKDMELNDIFHEFKKGVKEFLEDEDYETHYNLGIAYKEMGLINEAIGEFQLAIKGPERFFDTSGMLALCFKEKGMFQLAVNQLKKAIDDPRYDESEFLSLKYDLGSVYEEMNLLDLAYNAFMDVYAVDVNFRDVAQKIDKLKGSSASISLEKQKEEKKTIEKPKGGGKPEQKAVEPKIEEAKPVFKDKVEAGAGGSAKKGKKGKISYI